MTSFKILAPNPGISELILKICAQNIRINMSEIISKATPPPDESEKYRQFQCIVHLREVQAKDYDNFDRNRTDNYADNVFSKSICYYQNNIAKIETFDQNR